MQQVGPSYPVAPLISLRVILLIAWILSEPAIAAVLPDNDGDGIPNDWEVENSSDPNDAGDALTDTDGDTFSLLVEYALCGSPATLDLDLLPALIFVDIEGGIHAEVTFIRRRGNPCLVVLPELASDLTNWSAEAFALLNPPELLEEDCERVTYRSVDPITGPRNFVHVRLRIIRQLLNSGLGSESEILSPAIGSGGTTTLLPGDFIPGQDGPAASIFGPGKVVRFPVTGMAGSNLDLMQGEIEFWFKPSIDADADSDLRILFALGDFTTPPNLVLAESDRLTLTLSTGAQVETVEAPIGAALWKAGKWIHLRATWDTASTGDSLQIFIDGERVDGGGASGGWSLDGATPPSEFFIGAADVAGNFSAEGVFDEVIVRDHRQAWENTNTPPFVPPLGPFFALEETPLEFNVTALDAEGHGVNFVLDPEAPAGATLDPVTGVFSYTAPMGLAPATYEFCVRAIDNGTPRMSYAETVVLNVIGDNAPVLTNVLPLTQTATRTDSPQVTFDWSDADGDIVLIRCELSNVLGDQSFELASVFYEMNGFSGNTAFALLPVDLPFGITTYTLTLIDSQGNESSAESFDLDVVGTAAGGSPPALAFSLVSGTNPVHRPSGPYDIAFPNFNFSYSDVNGDAERLRLRIAPPGGAPVSIREILLADLGLGPGAASSGALSGWKPYPFRSTTTLGTWNFELTLYDANGNASPAGSVFFSLSIPTFGGQRTPFITSINPPVGSWGEQVTLGGIFPNPSAAWDEDIEVEISGTVVQVEFRSLSSVKFTIPEGTRSGPIQIRGLESGATTVSAEIYDIQPEVRIEPLNPQLFDETTLEPVLENVSQIVYPGDLFAFKAITTSIEENGGVTWSVDGTPGGNLVLGTIDETGLYTAPVGVPLPLEVAIRATLNSDPGVLDELFLEVVPPPLTPGAALVNAALGGVLRSLDARSALDIPGAALASNTTLSIQTIATSDYPAPRAGRRVLGGAVFGPGGLSFLSPATATIPLAHKKEEGAALVAAYYDPGTMTYTGETVGATVDPGGLTASCEIDHFSTVIIDETAPAAGAGAPVITMIEPAGGLEGDVTPVRITGANLATDLQVEVLDAGGSPTTEISAGPFLADPDGTLAGVAIVGTTLTDLADGVSRNYKIRLTRSGQPPAEATFTVDGLDELIVTSGNTVTFTNEPDRTFSEIDIQAGGSVEVAAGELNFTATGPVTIAGSIDGSGADGADGSGIDGAAAGQHGGKGGDGIERAPNVQLGITIANHFGDQNLGGDANVVDLSGNVPKGQGGDYGKSLKPDVISVVNQVIACVASLGAGGVGAVIACEEALEGLIGLVRDISDIANARQEGFQGYGAARLPGPIPVDGQGGGGGGGAGAFVAAVEAYLAGAEFRLRGGGGGAGGDGGHRVNIQTPKGLTVTGGGLVTTRGGDGGDGSNRSEPEFQITVVGVDVPYVGFVVPFDFPCYRGGGGGGGRGGTLRLVGNAGVNVTSTDFVDYSGGIAGQTGLIDIDPEVGEATPGEGRFHQSDGPAGFSTYEGPIVSDRDFHTKVTDRYIVNAEGLFEVFSGGGRVEPFVATWYEGSDTSMSPDTSINIPWNEDLARYDGKVLLQDGFNVLETNSAVRIRVLVIATDTDMDGLSDGDEADLGTDPGEPDTDGDGVDDGDEISQGTNPLLSDSDGDGLGDGEEIGLGTDPARFDSDDDGVSDSAEIVLGTSPSSGLSTPQDLPEGALVAIVENALGEIRVAIVDIATMRVGMFGEIAPDPEAGIAFDAAGELHVLLGGDIGTFNFFPAPGEESFEYRGFLPGGESGVSLAYNPGNGKLYTAELGPAPDYEYTGRILEIDPATLATTSAGLPLATPIQALAFTSGGDLYATVYDGTGGDDLLKLTLNGAGNPVTVTDTDDTGEEPLLGLAFGRDATLYASIYEGGSAGAGEILSLDPFDGTPSSELPHPEIFFIDLAVVPCAAPCLGTPEITVPLFGNYRFLETGNFNGDAYLDIVVIRDDFSGPSATVGIQVWTGDATGAFTNASHGFSQGGADSFMRNALVAVADLNGDGIDDIVSPNPKDPAGGTGIFLSQAGAPLSHLLTTITHSSRAVWVGIASMNPGTDTTPDIVIFTEDDIVVKFNDTGDGATFTEVTLPVPAGFDPGPLPLALGDLNNDTLPDIVIEGTFWLNTGSQTFASAQAYSFSSAQSSSAIAVADYNHDGFGDIGLIGADETFPFFAVFFGDGTGAFPTDETYPSDTSGSTTFDRIRIGDFDRDGIEEAIVGNFEVGYNVYYDLGLFTERIQELPDEDLDKDIYWIGTMDFTLGDITASGENDLITINGFEDGFYVYPLENPFGDAP